MQSLSSFLSENMQIPVSCELLLKKSKFSHTYNMYLYVQYVFYLGSGPIEVQSSHPVQSHGNKKGGTWLSLFLFVCAHLRLKTLLVPAFNDTQTLDYEVFNFNRLVIVYVINPNPRDWFNLVHRITTDSSIKSALFSLHL